MLLATTALVSMAATAPSWAGDPGTEVDWQDRLRQLEQGAAPQAGFALLQMAQTDAALSFDIPAQPLPQALIRFSRDTGIELFFDDSMARGLNSPGVHGSFTREEALSQLLAGTGLTYRFTNANTVTLEKLATDGSIQLDPLRVEDRQMSESAFGPVDGYVAKQNSTGAKTDTPISEVPQSVSVITRDQMDDRGARTVGDALSYSAGVLANVQGASSGLGGDSISIRGFGSKGSSGISDNEYWDGTRMLGTNFGSGHIDPYLFERIEVLRGPTSVLYGQNQPGGIVNRVSKRPPLETQGEVQVRGGSFETKELDFDVGGPMTEDDTLAYRMIGVVSDQESQMDFTGRERQLLSPNLTLRPSPDTTLTLQAVYQHDDMPGGFLQALPAEGTLFDTPSGKIPRGRFGGDPDYNKWNSESYALGYFFDHRFDDTWSVRQNFRYYHNEQDIEAIFILGVPPDGRTVDRMTFGVKDDADVFTLDNQVQADFTTGPLTHKLLMGVDLQRRENDDIRGFGMAPPINLFDPDYDVDIDEPEMTQRFNDVAVQAGLYAQDQVKLGGWILTFGGRYDWVDSDSTDEVNDVVSKMNETAFTGRAGLGYAFDNGVTPYVGFAQSFDPVFGTDFNGAQFKPTTGEQYEAGIKYEPVGYNAFVTLSAYQLTQQNVLTGDIDHPGFSKQTGEIRSRGIELEGVATLDNGLGFIASYTYLDQEVTKSNDADLGKRPTRMPEHQAAFWGSYEFQEGQFDGLKLGAGVRYVGSSMGDFENTFKVPSYTLFDAALSYDLSALDPRLAGVEFGVNATNIADKTYVAVCDYIGGCYYGIGRTVLARLTYTW